MAHHLRYGTRLTRLLKSFGFLSVSVALFAATAWPEMAWSQTRGRQAPNAPGVDAASPFGGALASCDKQQNEDTKFDLPSAKGEIKLDACYRGRKHLVCRNDAILAEEQSLADDINRILEKNYPNMSSLEAICQVKFEVLARDLASAGEFGKRFVAAKSESEGDTGCARKVRQQIHDLSLPDLTRAQDVQKSLVEVFDQEITRVSSVHERVSGLAAQLEGSERAMAALQKIHRAMCLKPAMETDASRAPAVN